MGTHIFQGVSHWRQSMNWWHILLAAYNQVDRRNLNEYARMRTEAAPSCWRPVTRTAGGFVPLVNIILRGLNLLHGVHSMLNKKLSYHALTTFYPEQCMHDTSIQLSNIWKASISLFFSLINSEHTQGSGKINKCVINACDLTITQCLKIESLEKSFKNPVQIRVWKNPLEFSNGTPWLHVGI